MFLYHLYGHGEDKNRYLKAKKNGLSPDLSSTYLGKGGGGAFFPEIMKDIQKESEYENWLDFEQGIIVVLEHYNFEDYLKFPVFSNKIKVFDRGITNKLFSYIEDKYVFDETGKAGTMIEPGTPDKITLVKNYWESRVSLEEFMLNQPFENPEIQLFERVPPNLIDV